MKRRIIISITMILSIALILFVYNLLQIMSVEDHYGDNQYFHYKSKPGDIVVNKSLNDFQRLDKNWTRMFYVENNDSIDLFHWLNDNKVGLYRSMKRIENVDKLTYSEIEELINRKELELIIEN